MGENRAFHGRCARTATCLACLMLTMALGCQTLPPAGGHAAAATDLATADDVSGIAESPTPPVPDENAPIDAGDEEALPAPEPDGRVDGQDQLETVAGDLNGDHVIDAGDVTAFAAALGTEAGDGGFNPELDFDRDGLISLVDHQIWYDLAFGP